MVTYRVTLAGDEFDLRSVCVRFSHAQPIVTKTQSGVVLTAPELDQAADADSAYRLAKNLLEEIRLVMRLGPRQLVSDITVDAVIEYHDNVFHKRWHYMSGVAKITFRMEGDLTVTPSRPSLSLEQRAIRLFPLYPVVREALGYRVKSDPPSVNLYKVYEVIEADMGTIRGKFGGWPTKAEDSAFGYSTNSPAAVGANFARHARGASGVPARQFTAEECEAFIDRLLREWIEGKYRKAEADGRFTPS